MREPISLEERVAVGLYRLCSSAENRTIAHLFGIGRSSVNMLYKDFCDTVIQKLEDDWLRMVRSDERTAHMREFFAVFGFPHSVGSLDGCHFPMSPLEEHATDHHSFKGCYSIILLALVDHQYRFRYINLGSPGRYHEANVYGRSILCTLVETDHFRSPVLVIENSVVKPVILCDQAFSLTTHLLKPYANSSSETREALQLQPLKNEKNSRKCLWQTENSLPIYYEDNRMPPAKRKASN
ncbi:unnamed protein product [Ixodes pacificus]